MYIRARNLAPALLKLNELDVLISRRGCRIIRTEERTKLAVLNNPRHELFAQLVVSGKSLTESFLSAGFSKGNATSCARRLSKKEQVRTRIAELQSVAAQVAITRATIDRDWVLSGLREIAENGESEGARVRALELCGKELGMFVDRTDHNFQFNGDLMQFSAQQIDAMLEQLEKKIEDAERKQLAATGGADMVINIEPELLPEPAVTSSPIDP